MRFKTSLYWSALAFSLCAGVLTGCSSDKTVSAPAPADGSKPVAPAGRKFKIGVSVPAADHGWTAGVIYWAKKSMADNPDVEWTFATAENPDKQIKDLETMMVKGVDAIVVLATESAPLTPIAEQIHDRGIMLVNVDRGFLKPVADVLLEGDNVAFGRKSAEFMVDKLKGKGNIVILEGIPCTVNTARVDAFNEVVKKNPGIKVLDSQTGMWNKEKAMNLMQTYLLKHKQIDAVWAADDDMALGAEQALKEAGRDKGVWILGGAGMKDIVKRVMDGDAMFPGDITYPPAMISQGIDEALKALKAGQKGGSKEQRHVTIDVELILPDNAKKFYFPDSIY